MSNKKVIHKELALVAFIDGKKVYLTNIATNDVDEVLNISLKPNER
jgi:hypothetical protein